MADAKTPATEAATKAASTEAASTEAASTKTPAKASPAKAQSARATLEGALRRARNIFPLTGLGLGIAAMSAAALYYGFSAVDLVLLGAGGIGAIAVLLGALTVGLGALRIRSGIKKQHVPEGAAAMECGYPMRTGFRLPGLRWLPGVRVTWRWIEPAAEVRVLRAGLWLDEEITPRVRGWAESVVRRVTVGDAFGLAAITLEPREERPVRILPSVGGLKQMHVVRTLSGGSDISHPDGSADGERLDLRAYAPGDPIRYVLWNVFARTRELVIRTPERALSAARKTTAYLVSGPGDEPAAGAARVAVDVGALGGDWTFGADGVAEPADNRDAAFEALARSSRAKPEDCGKGLANFVKQSSADGGGRALVFVPGKPGPWLDGVLAAAAEIPRDAQGRAPLEFIVCTDGVHTGRSDSFFRKWTLQGGADPNAHDAPVHADELNRVVAALGKLHAKVMVVDRRDGHVHVAGGR